MAKYEETIRVWAERHYDNSYAHSVIVECWDEEDFARYDDAPNSEAAIREIERDFVDAMNESYAGATMDMEEWY